MDKIHLGLVVALVASEALAAIVQLIFPANKGFSGILATVIKLLQGAGVQDPPKV